MKRAASGLSRVWIVLCVVLLLLAFLFQQAFFRVRSHMMGMRQAGQLHSMNAGIELFENEDGYQPPSDANDPTGKPYCGAMKLAEALMGRDLRGFHPQSAFRCDGLDPNTLTPLYPASPSQENLNARVEPYAEPELAHPCRLADIYGKGKTGPFPEDAYVLCDAFERKRPGGKRTGMPVLYYRADRLRRAHQTGDPNNIYDNSDNLALIALGVPGKPHKTHPLIDPRQFSLYVRECRNASHPQPYRLDSHILISAGEDGLYGTTDDICCFGWDYREQ